MGILDDVDEIIDSALGIPHKGQPPYYKHRAAYNFLFQGSPPPLDGAMLVENLYRHIEKNWESRKPSPDNWKLRRRENYSRDNRSRETRLEREIIQLDQANPPTWYNQISTSSGLLGSREDKRRAVDLIHNCSSPTGKQHYELIELKIQSDTQSDTPLSAAFEVLQYGLLYLFSRRNMSRLGYTHERQKRLLGADGIHLRVLAPQKFYEPFKLGWLEQSLSQGISTFTRAKEFEVEMDFAFLVLRIEMERLIRKTRSNLTRIAQPR